MALCRLCSYTVFLLMYLVDLNCGFKINIMSILLSFAGVFLLDFYFIYGKLESSNNISKVVASINSLSLLTLPPKNMPTTCTSNSTNPFQFETSYS